MKYLLDTHIFLWYIENDSRLDEKFYHIIEDSTNEIYLSVVAVWELIIKASLGKFKCDLPIIDFSNKYCILHNIRFIDLIIEDLQGLESLPHIHRDPFDRLMIVQSKNRNISFISNDTFVKRYFE
jgi:PIN domain nuclease of toxin-antitoxin system